MSLFGSPAPQWTEVAPVTSLSSMVLVLDGDGFYRLYEAVTPTGYFEDDGTGTVLIVASSASPMRITRVVATDTAHIY